MGDWMTANILLGGWGDRVRLAVLYMVNQRSKAASLAQDLLSEAARVSNLVIPSTPQREAKVPIPAAASGGGTGARISHKTTLREAATRVLRAQVISGLTERVTVEEAKSEARYDCFQSYMSMHGQRHRNIFGRAAREHTKGLRGRLHTARQGVTAKASKITRRLSASLTSHLGPSVREGLKKIAPAPSGAQQAAAATGSEGAQVRLAPAVERAIRQLVKGHLTKGMELTVDPLFEADDGCLGKPAFSDLLAKATNGTVTEHMVSVLWETIDTERDNDIEYTEFVEWLLGAKEAAHYRNLRGGLKGGGDGGASEESVGDTDEFRRYLTGATALIMGSQMELFAILVFITDYSIRFYGLHGRMVA